MGVKKVTAQEVIEQIQQDGQITVEEISKIYGVCSATIRSRLRELRQDGSPIFFDANGLFIMDDINEDNMRAFQKYTKWVVSTLIGVSGCGSPSKVVMLEYKKQLKELLKELMTREERKLLTKNMTVISRMLDYIQIDEEMED